MSPRTTSLTSLIALSLASLSAFACGSEEEELILAPEIGTGDHSSASVRLTVVASAADGLNQPRDLDFNPLRPNELWVMNFADDSALIISEATSDAPTFEKRIDGYAEHFMEEVTAIDFGQNETTFGIEGTFGTCGESRNTYNGRAPGNDFTGPSLWSSDMSVFAAQNPNGLGSHLDMLHNTPLCMGIAHEAANRYWTVGGLHKSIDLYDFEQDDGIGNDDHLDGKTWRYAEGEMGYKEGVGHHLALDAVGGFLYVSDPGNGRVARLDVNSGTEGPTRAGLETPIKVMEGALLEDFVRDSSLMNTPSGLELHNDLIFVSEHDTGHILAFDLEGELVNYLATDLGAGSLGGMSFGPDGKLYLVDTIGNQVLRVDPL